jgi:predicted amidohydrolase YtcJ
MEPLRAAFIAVTRTTPEGMPAGGWYPENRISVPAALRHFTRDAAFAGFAEKWVGSLTPGRLADFVVLSENVLDAPGASLLRTRVLLTVMGGRDTHRDPGLAPAAAARATAGQGRVPARTGGLSS